MLNRILNLQLYITKSISVPYCGRYYFMNIAFLISIIWHQKHHVRRQKFHFVHVAGEEFLTVNFSDNKLWSRMLLHQCLRLPYCFSLNSTTLRQIVQQVRYFRTKLAVRRKTRTYGQRTYGQRTHAVAGARSCFC